MPSDQQSFAEAIARMRAKALALPVAPSHEPTDAEVVSTLESLAGCGYVPSEQIVGMVRSFLAGDGLLLSGPTGAGKTHLLRAFGVPTQHANDNIIAQYGLDGVGEWFAFWDAKPVCLDDIGVEPLAAHFGAKDDLIIQIVGHRAERQPARTFATTNLTADEICARYGERTLSRLLGMCKPFKFAGADWRKRRPGRSVAGYDSLLAIAKTAALVEWRASGVRPASTCMRQVAETLRGAFGIVRRADGSDPRGDAVCRGIEAAWAEIDAAGGADATLRKEVS